MISGSLKKRGLINAMPDLGDLDSGDLKYKVDFKNIYATVLSKWLDADSTTILSGNYDSMDFI